MLALMTLMVAGVAKGQEVTSLYVSSFSGPVWVTIDFSGMKAGERAGVAVYKEGVRYLVASRFVSRDGDTYYEWTQYSYPDDLTANTNYVVRAVRVDADGNVVELSNSQEYEFYIHVDSDNNMSITGGQVKYKIDDLFEDDAFKSYVSDHVDLDKDGYLGLSEIINTKNVEIKDKSVNLDAIGMFPNVEGLTLENCTVSGLWLGSLPKLNSVALLNCVLEDGTCDLSEGYYVTDLDVENTNLGEVNLEYYTNLKVLTLVDCGLTELSVENNSKLESLNCDGNQLTSIGMSSSANPNLTQVSANENKIMMIDVSSMNLTKFDCTGSKIETTATLKSDGTLSVLVPEEIDASKIYDVEVEDAVSIGLGGWSGNVTLRKNGSNVYLDFQFEGATAKKLKGKNLIYKYNPGVTKFDSDCYLHLTDVDSEVTCLVIDETSFPDEAFRNYILANVDDGDLELCEDEIAAVKEISLENVGVKSLEGLALFTNLEKLSLVDMTSLEGLDVSANVKLEQLILNKCGKLTGALDLSKNTALKSLMVAGAPVKITTLDSNTALENVIISQGDKYSTVAPLPSFANLTKLVYLNVGQNQGYELNLGELPSQIEYLIASGCWFTKVEGDWSKQTKLSQLEIDNNSLIALDLSTLPNKSAVLKLNDQTGEVECLLKGAELYVKVPDGIALEADRISGMKIGEETFTTSGVEIEGAAYIKLTSVNGKAYTKTEASELVGKTASYSYDTKAGSTLMSVAVTLTKVEEYSQTGCVELNEKNFPDATFRAYLSDTKGFGFDGMLCPEEAETVSKLTFNSSATPVESLVGIEHLTSLQGLTLEGQNITSIDLKSNSSLKTVVVKNMPSLKTVELGANVSETLYLQNVGVSSLDISKNTNIKTVKLVELSEMSEMPDFSKNTSLGWVGMSGMPNVGNFDIDKLPKNLTQLELANDGIESIDLSSFTKLNEVILGHNSLMTLDLTNCKAKEGSVSGQKVECDVLVCGRSVAVPFPGAGDIDLTRFTSVQVGDVLVDVDKVKEIDGKRYVVFTRPVDKDMIDILEGNTIVYNYDTRAQSTKLQVLDVTVTPKSIVEKGFCNCVELTAENFADEQFRSLLSEYDTDKDGALCDAELMTELSVDITSKNISTLVGVELLGLKSVSVLNNGSVEKSIDLQALSECDKLETVVVGKSPIAISNMFDYNALSNLTSLCLANVKLPEGVNIDVTKLAGLTTLHLVGLGLEAVDLSKNLSLEELDLSNNSLVAIDLSKHTALKTVDLGGQTSEVSVKYDETAGGMVVYVKQEGVSVEATRIKNVKLDGVAVENNVVSGEGIATIKLTEDPTKVKKGSVVTYEYDAKGDGSVMMSVKMTVTEVEDPDIDCDKYFAGLVVDNGVSCNGKVGLSNPRKGVTYDLVNKTSGEVVQSYECSESADGHHVNFADTVEPGDYEIVGYVNVEGEHKCERTVATFWVFDPKVLELGFEDEIEVKKGEGGKYNLSLEHGDNLTVGVTYYVSTSDDNRSVNWNEGGILYDGSNSLTFSDLAVGDYYIWATYSDLTSCPAIAGTLKVKEDECEKYFEGIEVKDVVVTGKTFEIAKPYEGVTYMLKPVDGTTGSMYSVEYDATLGKIQFDDIEPGSYEYSASIKVGEKTCSAVFGTVTVKEENDCEKYFEGIEVKDVVVTGSTFEIAKLYDGVTYMLKPVDGTTGSMYSVEYDATLGKIQFDDIEPGSYEYSASIKVGDKTCSAVFGTVTVKEEISEDCLDIDKTFPDAVFSAYVKAEIDKNSDGKLCEEEVAVVTTVDLSGTGVASLAGLEKLTAVETLKINNTQFTTIDLSKYRTLKNVELSGTKCTTLDLRNSVELVSVVAADGELTSVKLPTAGLIEKVDLSGNKLWSVELEGVCAATSIVSVGRQKVETQALLKGGKLGVEIPSNLDLERVWNIKVDGKEVDGKVTFAYQGRKYLQVATDSEEDLTGKTMEYVFDTKAGADLEAVASVTKQTKTDGSQLPPASTTKRTLPQLPAGCKIRFTGQHSEGTTTELQISNPTGERVVVYDAGWNVVGETSGTTVTVPKGVYVITQKDGVDCIQRYK